LPVRVQPLEAARVNRNPALTIRKELQWHCRQMLTSRLKTINSFDASAMVAVGIIVAQLLFG
jgi:hypothetical protein